MRSRDEQGRPTEVEFRASALGRSTHYTLGYDYAQAPDVLAWQHGARRHHAHHRRRVPLLAAPATAAPRCATTSRSSWSCRCPGFVKRRAEVRILNTVRELKARAEA